MLKEKKNEGAAIDEKTFSCSYVDLANVCSFAFINISDFSYVVVVDIGSSNDELSSYYHIVAANRDAIINNNS